MASLPQQERPSLLIIVEKPTRHIIVLWGIEIPPFSYANRTAHDGHIVTFYRDIVEGETPPTIAISDEWWDLGDRTVPSQHTASTKVINIRLEYHIIPKATEGAERESILVACIAPLAFTHPLLTAPYTSTAVVYRLLSERNAAWNWDAQLAPLMIWIRASLYQTCPGVKYHPPLEMADQITVRR